MAIHPTAIVSKEANIAPSADIGPYVTIEGKVTIGERTRIMSWAYIGPGTEIGEDNQIHMGAIVGHVPQDRAFKGGETYLKIGNKNIIREYATIHRGTAQGSSTIIGNGCFLMGGCHIAHNSVVGNNVIMCNFSGMAGYTTVGDGVFISGGVVIHQRTRIGRLVMFSGNTRVSMDVPPFMLAAERNQIWAVNVEGLRRAGFSKKTIEEIKEVYKIYFRRKILRRDALKIIESDFKSPEVGEFVRFVKESKNGICRGR